MFRLNFDQHQQWRIISGCAGDRKLGSGWPHHFTGHNNPRRESLSIKSYVLPDLVDFQKLGVNWKVRGHGESEKKKVAQEVWGFYKAKFWWHNCHNLRKVCEGILKTNRTAHSGGHSQKWQETKTRMRTKRGHMTIKVVRFNSKMSWGLL